MKFNFNSTTQTQSIITILNDQWMDSSAANPFNADVREPRVRKFRPGREERPFHDARPKARRFS